MGVWAQFLCRCLRVFFFCRAEAAGSSWINLEFMSVLCISDAAQWPRGEQKYVLIIK